MKSTREEVYKAIDGERDYQAKRWNENTTTTAGVHSVTEYLVYMQDYVNEALHTVSRTGDPLGSTAGLDIIRKVTALGVACMEQNGAIKRPGY